MEVLYNRVTSSTSEPGSLPLAASEMSVSTRAGSARAPANLLARFIGVITSPRETFEDVVARPHWLGMLALVCVAMAVVVGGFMFTTVGQEAWLDAAAASPWNPDEVTDEQYETMRRIAGFAGYLAVAQMLVVIPLIFLITAAILFAVFNVAFGGDASFNQLFAVIVHTGPIGLLAQMFTVPLNYARGTLSSATNLAVLLPMLDEESLAGRLVSMIDLFLVWQLVVLAIGLAVLYRRRTEPIAGVLFAVYGIVAAILALVLSRPGGA